MPLPSGRRSIHWAMGRGPGGVVDEAFQAVAVRHLPAALHLAGLDAFQRRRHEGGVGEGEGAPVRVQHLVHVDGLVAGPEQGQRLAGLLVQQPEFIAVAQREGRGRLAAQGLDQVVGADQGDLVELLVADQGGAPAEAAGAGLLADAPGMAVGRIGAGVAHVDDLYHAQVGAEAAHAVVGIGVGQDPVRRPASGPLYKFGDRLPGQAPASRCMASNSSSKKKRRSPKAGRSWSSQVAVSS